ncbi:DUF551 domain-containing protein [Enterobacter ludwigii]|uniref:DUF551 domain-containing protein n=1 Tax=Enterobacter ludwigii TaxID=299767 RepID=UPI002E284105|nr:DUF551 domain-containing protein [Enterobacter ludwigii]MED5734133.1 DUF551 domain-containing protein [Enterobacter ludwigii]
MSTITKQEVQAVSDLKAGYTLGHADVAILNELAEIALASLEAEAVAYIRAAHNPDGFCFADGIHPTHRHQKLPLSTLQDGCYWTVTPLYTAPPAPVSVPEEVASAIEALKQTMVDCNRYNYCFDAVKRVEDACRAAMLQGAEPVTTTYKLPDGWVACSERMPEKCERDIWLFDGEFVHHGYVRDGYQFVDWNEEYNSLPGVTHWMPMSLPAAPQQEVK